MGQDKRQHTMTNQPNENRYCTTCGVQVSPHYSLCPLCKGKLVEYPTVKPYALAPKDEPTKQIFASPPNTNPIPAKKRITLIGSIFLGLAIPATISLVSDLVTNGFLTWSPLVLVSLAYLGLSIASGIAMSPRADLVGILLVLITGGFFLLLNRLIGPPPWAQPIAIPILILFSGLLTLGVLVARALRLELFPILGLGCFLASIFFLGTDLILVLGIDSLDQMLWSWIVLGVLGPLGTMFFLIQWYISRREGVRTFFYW
jgi:hypothetical protein